MASTRLKKAGLNYIEFCQSGGKVKPLEEYKGSQTKIKHLCLEHGEIHYSRPGDIKQGIGLACCKAAYYNRFRDEYQSRLDEFGKVEALEDYVNATKPILHRCKKHGEVHYQTPQRALRGCGLKCCQGGEVQNFSKGRQYIEQYPQLCEELGKVKPLEPYKGSHVKIKHKCLRHGEVHEARPFMVLRGQGLRCCMVGGDNAERFLKDNSWANSECYLYLASINGHYTKPGIAQKVDERADDFYTGISFTSPKLSRCEAWVIEQRLLKETADAKPTELPEMYQQWTGRTELRLKDIYTSQWFEQRFWELLRELQEVGCWLTFYEQKEQD